MSSRLEVDPRPITVEEYHRMIEAGIFGEDDRIELLDGIIARMSPQSPEHARVIRWLTNQVARVLPESLSVSPQLPLTIGASSEPEPDLAVVPAHEATAGHPRTALLVIEVAGASLRQDRLVKSALYARAEIPEYWIVNLAEACIECHRDPDAANARYRTLLTFSAGEQASSLAVAAIRVDVARLFARSAH